MFFASSTPHVDTITSPELLRQPQTQVQKASSRALLVPNVARSVVMALLNTDTVRRPGAYVDTSTSRRPSQNRWETARGEGRGALNVTMPAGERLGTRARQRRNRPQNRHFDGAARQTRPHEALFGPSHRPRKDAQIDVIPPQKHRQFRVPPRRKREACGTALALGVVWAVCGRPFRGPKQEA